MALSATLRRVLTVTAAALVLVLVVLAVVVNRALSPETIRPIAERELGRVLNQPVRIGRVEVTLVPRPQVTGGDIRIGGGGAATAPSLQVSGLKILPRLSSLLAGGLAIDLIEIQGLSLAVRRDQAGQWHLPFGAPAAANEPARQPDPTGDGPAPDPSPIATASPADTGAPGAAPPSAAASIEIGEMRLTGGRLTIVDDVLRSPAGSAEVASITDVAALVRAGGGTVRLESITGAIGRSTLSGKGEFGPAGVHLTLAWDVLTSADLPQIFGLAGTAPIPGLSVDGKRPLDLDVTVAPGGAPTITGTVRADRIAKDALTVTSASSPISYAGSVAKAELKAASLQAGTLTISAIASPLVFDGTTLVAEPITFTAYGGAQRGRFTFTPGPSAWWALVSAFDGIDIGAFLDANTSAKGRLAGKGGLDVNVKAPVTGELAQTLAGTVGMAITQGVIKDFALLAAINTALGITGGEGKDTTFDRMSGTLAIAGGVVKTTDLLLQMGELRVAAEGSLGLVDQALAFTGRGTLSKQKTTELTKNGKDLRLLANKEGELEFPVKIGGTTAAPTFQIDLAKMAKTAATNAVKKEVTKGLNRFIPKKK